MSACLRCHDGVEASAECSLCHVEDVAFAGESSIIFAPRSMPPVTECGGCHDQTTCDACHGMRMPHSAEFLDYGHAREAGFEKKRACWRCHTMGECSHCHAVKPENRGYWGHGDGFQWKQQHTLYDPGEAGCGCHGANPYSRAGNYCAACH